MHRFFGEQDAYSLFNMIGFWAMLFTNLFYYKSKKGARSLYFEKLISASSKVHKYLGVGVGIFLFVLETYLATTFVDKSSQYNGWFGSLVGTGFNYFGVLTLFPIYMLLYSLIFAVNPLKEIDIMTMGLPVFLFFVKIACFLNGCCWGIEWEHGLYNHHYDHPGYQVPVQAIEAFWAVLILVILLIYRRKAKVGTIYPMYLTLFCFTRFFSEFFRADYPDVIGPFNVYHLLCMAGFVIGIILLIVMRKYGEKLSVAYEINAEKTIKGISQKIVEKIAEERNDEEDE